MKLRNTPIEIDEQKPFENLFKDREKFGNSLYNLLASSEGGFVAFVDGNWGEGKSTFIRAFRQFIRIGPKPVDHSDERKQSIEPDSILFDAFVHDGADDPIASFTREISAFIGNLVPENEHRNFLKASAGILYDLGGGFLSKSIGYGISLVAASHGSDPQTAAALGEAASAGASSLANNSKEAVFKSLEAKTSLETDARSFEDKLSGIAKAYRDNTGFPLTIIVDELDRCSPSFALTLIERIKSFFEVEELCFLIFVNLEQIERHVAKEYGAIDTTNYLRKFCDVVLKFPRNHHSSTHYYGGNAHEYGIFLREQNANLHFQDAWIAFTVLITPLGLSLREVEAVSRQLVLLQASERTAADVVGPLAVIKVKYPKFFDRLKYSKIDYKELLGLFDLQDSRIVSTIIDAIATLGSGFLDGENYKKLTDTLGDTGHLPRAREYEEAAKYAIECLEVFKI